MISEKLILTAPDGLHARPAGARQEHFFLPQCSEAEQKQRRPYRQVAVRSQMISPPLCF